MTKLRVIISFQIFVVATASVFTNNKEQFVLRHQKGSLDDQSSVLKIGHHVAKRDVQPQTPCKSGQVFNGTEQSLFTKYNFTDTASSMMIAWCGNNARTLIVAIVEEFPSNGRLYKSTDGGKTYTDITKATLQAGDTVVSLQRHPTDPEKVYVVAHGTHYRLYIPDNLCSSFTGYDVPFSIFSGFSGLMIHPGTSHKDVMFYLDDSDVLYLSVNGGKNWVKKLDNVNQAKWSEGEDCSLFATVDNQADDFNLFNFFFGVDKQEYDLMKLSNCGSSSSSLTKLREHVHSFGIQGNFLYITVYLSAESKKEDERMLEVSSDGGLTWDETQLPSVSPDRFYSVLDMSEGLVFMHVDSEGITGHGTLYTSGASGITYSVSLERHLYSEGVGSDFYKVQSMRGVYLASQIQEDGSVSSLISYDRGGEWHPIPTTECPATDKTCSLHIHNQYSHYQNIPVNLPLSTEAAPGLILAHGHIGTSLQTTPPDIYITTDGGYRWFKSLTGPHDYEILDSGGIILAYDKNTVSEIKISTDFGHCWESVSLGVDLTSFQFEKLLSEPGGKETYAIILASNSKLGNWESTVLDFTKLNVRKCTDTDFVDFVPHQQQNKPGCFLGLKETLHLPLSTSWCLVQSSQVQPPKSDPCDCTTEDYECDYGYVRDPKTNNCVLDSMFQGPELDICKRGHKYEIITKGYRKLPGDQCRNGLVYQDSQQIDLHRVCVEGDRSVLISEMNPADRPVQAYVQNGSSFRFHLPYLLIAVLAVLALGFLAAILVIKLRRKHRLIRMHYARLREAESRQTEASHTSLFDSASESDTGGPVINGSIPSVALVISGRQPPITVQTNGSAHKQGADEDLKLPKRTSNFYHDQSDDDLLE